jgi:predicted glycogen debranching enzyme
VTQEWLETNGLGGFASSTAAGMNTRRYHGLLTAATKPPVGRFVLLSKLEETLIIGGRRYDLSTNQFPGVVHPQGYRYLQEFRRDPFPTSIYRVEGIEIEKRVFMIHSQNATVIEYESASECSLELRPLIAFRDFHGTTHQNDAADRALHIGAGTVSIAPYPDLPALHFGHNGAVDPAGDWYFNFEYSEELARGLDGHEDLFHPFTLRFSGNAIVVASTERYLPARFPS